uniref:DNA-directed RNA polymerase M/15kDa subunit domain-containing protein n=1 Tax=viral metagenome TaxID=1070528 RepID=A0A6C0BVV5_9ZZZZ
MNFCSKCDNMYYIRLSSPEENTLVHYCRNCGNEDSALSSNELSVSKIELKKTKQTQGIYINEYTKLDPTVPRIKDIDCPNNTCICNTSAEEENDILYVRYDDDNIRYIYMCCHCDTKWKSAEM